MKKEEKYSKKDTLKFFVAKGDKRFKKQLEKEMGIKIMLGSEIKRKGRAI